MTATITATATATATACSPVANPVAAASTGLVADLCAGRPGAFGTLDSTYRPMILATARRCGLSPDDADDVAQETLTAAFHHIADLGEPAALPGWLRTTAARAAWRMSSARRPRTDQLARLAVVAPAEDVDAGLIRDETRRRVAAALGRLSPRDQLVLALTVTAEPALPYSVVAERLGCAIGSIGAFRRRALDRLERALAATSRPTAA